jgi:hypothetical protein
MANEKTYKLILETEYGDPITLAEKCTLPQANLIVDGLDARWDAYDWDGDGPPETDPLAHYEGCNILAQADGIDLLYTGESGEIEAWEKI